MTDHAPRRTIVALATSPGRAGVAVIRISGPEAGAALRAISGHPMPEPRKAALHHWRHPASKVWLDTGLSLWFPSPHSFTGEDVAELHAHGSPATTKALLEALLSLPGIRLAEPGEFSRRAFLHGKMDLMEAEALADLLNAQTESQRLQALRAMNGETSRTLEEWRESIGDCLALLEAYIDFPDEDIPENVQEEVAATLSAIANSIASELDSPPIGERIRSGVVIAIIGAPNVGKSSLMNRLAQREVAIVSNIAGTTRDTLELELDIGGSLVTIIDTAGLRDSQDPIEQEGVRRARAKAECADAILLMRDHSLPYPALPPRPIPIIHLRNKSELHGPETTAPQEIALSLKEKTGLEELHRALTNLVRELTATAHPPLITQLRHRRTLEDMREHLQHALDKNKPLELRCEDIRLASEAIGALTGRISVDETLGKIFGRFCIGK
ncbi:tRNA uridine-5-carboxymethylaminomethyl(34) synthesis GTPase MnmE [bacterium]|nr:tRNA uridine-5-carboxymethylaminomethyl(34) synthesis GTPase MnmE [bacterium]